MSNIHHGSSFDDFLREEGIYDEVTAIAGLRAVIWQLRQAMEEGNISKTELAKRMHTSRSQVDRILNGTGEGIGLDSIERAAEALGKRIRVELV